MRAVTAPHPALHADLSRTRGGEGKSIFFAAIPVAINRPFTIRH
jgi:hypothetical protein